MQIVIDANVIISMLIKPGVPADIFLKEEMEVFAPELIIKEVYNYKDMIIKKAKISDQEFDKFFSIIKQKIIIVPEEEFIKCRDHAEKICPDKNDILYFALALYMQCPIWSNDKKLKEQSVIKIFATHEIIDSFGD